MTKLQKGQDGTDWRENKDPDSAYIDIDVGQPKKVDFRALTRKKFITPSTRGPKKCEVGGNDELN